MLNFRKVASERVSYNIVIQFIVLFVFRGEELLFNANVAIFQLYHGQNKLIFNEMMMRTAAVY
jgi:hypothetical protein